MDDLKASVRGASDFAALERAGVITNMGQERLAALSPDAPLIAAQDALFGTFWRVVFNVVRSRSSSIIRFTYGFPALLGGILHEDLAKSAESMKLFRACSEAFEAAKGRAGQRLQKMVWQCPLNGLFLRWCVKFAAAGNWERPTEQLLRMLHCLFRGFGQTKIIEDSIGKLRDLESRAAPSKDIAHFAEWQRLLDSKLFETYERPTVNISSAAPVKDNFNADTIFHTVAKSDGSTDSTKLKEIGGKETWPTFNAQSVKNCSAHLALMVLLHSEDKWAEAEAAIYAQLLPEGQIVLQGTTGKIFLVVKVLEVAALTWPVVECGANIFELDLTIQKLEWVFAFGVDDFSVLSVSVMSPLRVLTVGGAISGGFKFGGEAAESVPFLAWQANRGFAHVPESILSMLCDDADLSTVMPAITDVPQADILALLLIMKQFPEIGVAEARAIMYRRNHEEDELGQSYLDDWDEEAVADVVIVGDAAKTKAFMKERANAVTRRATARANTERLLDTCFEPCKKGLKLKQRANRKNAQRREEEDLARRRHESTVALRQDSKQFLLDRKPGPARVYVHDREGRFKLNYPGFKGKSVAWQERGSENQSSCRCSFCGLGITHVVEGSRPMIWIFPLLSMQLTFHGRRNSDTLYQSILRGGTVARALSRMARRVWMRLRFLQACSTDDASRRVQH